MLIAVMASSVFSVALTAKQSGGKGQRKLLAAQASKQLTGMLKNYVTADYTSASVAALGPNSTNAFNTWSLESAALGITCTHSGGAGVNHYALLNGSHTVTGILPGWMEQPPYNGTVVYHVCGTGCFNSRTASDASVMPGVTVNIDWTEP